MRVQSASFIALVTLTYHVFLWGSERTKGMRGTQQITKAEKVHKIYLGMNSFEVFRLLSTKFQNLSSPTNVKLTALSIERDFISKTYH